MGTKDYYKLLELNKNASDSEIKKNYRKLAMKYHPDKNKGDKHAEERFKEISEAYAVLSDKEKRKNYDMFGSEKFHQKFSQEDIFQGFDLGDLFGSAGFGGSRSRKGGINDIFNMMGGGGFNISDMMNKTRPQPNNLETEIYISFHESVKGCEKTFSFKNNSGQIDELTVKIPPGIDTGKKLRLAKKGGRSYNGTVGDLFIKIFVKNDPTFKRDGYDVTVTKEVKYSEAVLGTNVSIPTLDQVERKIKIPPGTQPGTKIRIKNQGIKHLNNTKHGDLYVLVNVSIPTKISKSQKNIIQELANNGL